MKTTLNIDDTVMQRLREEAARRGTTMSAFVEAALRSVLAMPTPSAEPKGAVEERLTEALAEEAKIQDLMKEGKELIRVAPPQERGELGRTLAARVKSHAGGVTRPGTIGVTPSRARNVAPRSPRGRAEAARNPLGGGHLRPSALSFVGGDHPDRHPPHFAPSDRRSPPRLPRDFRHGLLGQNGRQLARVRARIRRLGKELEKTDLEPLEPGPSKAKDFDNAPPDTLPPLPTWRSGGFRVDIANREEIYRVMEEE